MKTIAQKVWSEPAVFIGLLVTLGLLAVALITHQAIDAGIIVGILAPLGSALGIRQFVTPTTTTTKEFTMTAETTRETVPEQPEPETEPTETDPQPEPEPKTEPEPEEPGDGG